MICKNCGSECPDGNIFCEKCGAELESSVLPENIDSKGRIVNESAKNKQSKPKAAPKHEKIHLTEGQKAARKKALKTGGIVAAVIVVIVLFMLIVNLVNSSKGYAYATKISLGRNVEYAESETGLKFSKKSENGMINSMAGFDYIYISDEKVRVSGSEQPKWAILLNVDKDEMITDVQFYDFTQLKLNWKGNKTDSKLTEESLTYGMSIKSVNKTLGLKPYYLKRSVSNDSVYCYRYYFTDPDAGYDRAFNYYVDFSETELTVRSISYSEIEYAKTILDVTTNMPVPETKSEKEVYDKPGSTSDDDSEGAEDTDASSDETSDESSDNTEE